MKTITLSFILLAFSVHAQTFPSPYCDVEETGVTVEEITSVAFADASITNADDSTVLIDKTSTIANLIPGDTYTLTVEGNTYGAFDTNIVAFIDWNQNETLDDQGEVYEIGTITNSDGNDNTSVSMDITVPMDAVEGPTRIRITKTFGDIDSPAIINSCAIEMDAFGMGAFPGFGQALDFTLDIEEASTGGFPAPYCNIEETGVTVEEITSVAFADASITNADDSSVLIDKTSTTANLIPGDTYTLTVEGNTYGGFDTNIVAFIDWNQNETLDDQGEVYEIGTITNSDGNDNTSVSMDITVPMDAVEGPTRIRITKTFGDIDSPAIINPCAIEMDAFGMGAFPGFGQALDFTLEIEEASNGGFPAPYCDVDGTGVTVEEITSVTFADASITNSDDSSVLIDETSTVTNLTRGETYTITVEGNTYGGFDTNIVAFIDWNQNETLDDQGEVYEIGTITNSDGNDNTSVSMDITVPMDAVEGPTRIRITKTFGDIDSPAIINPCAIEMDAFGMGAFPGFGQALDFTLEIGVLGVDSFDTNSLKVYPVPTSDVLNIEYKSVINSVKIYNLVGKEVYSQNTSGSQLQVNVSSLSAGAYIVKLIAEEAQHNFQIIKK